MVVERGRFCRLFGGGGSCIEVEETGRGMSLYSLRYKIEDVVMIESQSLSDDREEWGVHHDCRICGAEMSVGEDDAFQTKSNLGSAKRRFELQLRCDWFNQISPFFASNASLASSYISKFMKSNVLGCSRSKNRGAGAVRITCSSLSKPPTS